MTFGEQNTQSEAHAQLDYAVEQGVNFVDTAEMYPIAARESTYGSTEKFIGNWFKTSGSRQDMVLATKIAGPNRNMGYVRKNLDFSKESILLSVEKSLQRLQTDYIDLYQFHWPERKVNFFGQRGYTIQEDHWQDNFHSILHTMQQLIAAGKIRHIGVSNETPWGLMRFLEESKKFSFPKTITIQNAYSLVNRMFEHNLAEVCHRENVGLLAYSPLGFGSLTGKYLTGIATPESRLNQFPNFTRYNSERTKEAIKKYIDIADQHEMSVADLALAFVHQSPFVTSTIIGATDLTQLKTNIESINMTLPDSVLKEIEKVHSQIPDPAP